MLFSCCLVDDISASGINSLHFLCNRLSFFLQTKEKDEIEKKILKLFLRCFKKTRIYESFERLMDIFVIQVKC
jgi:hypothetical protein